MMVRTVLPALNQAQAQAQAQARAYAGALIYASESPAHVGASLRPALEYLLLIDDAYGSLRRVDEG